MKLIKYLISLCLFITLCACSNNKLAEIYDEDTIITKAKELITLANAYDYEAVCDMAILPENMTKEELVKTVEDGWDSILKKQGAFVEYTQYQVAGKHDKKLNEDYAVIAMRVKYENGESVFTFYFNEEYEVIGLYLK